MLEGGIARGTTVPICDSLHARRWRQVQALAEVQRAFADNPESAADAAVNRWLTIDMGHGSQAIHGEVTGWDVSGLPAVHHMARQQVLRNNAAGIALLRQFLAEQLWLVVSSGGVRSHREVNYSLEGVGVGGQGCRGGASE